MQTERFYLGCLAHASYLIHDGGEAAVIDPQRDVDLYIGEALRLGVTIRWVIETHLHADFVSGHVELALRTGATICLGAGSGVTFEHREVVDGETLPLGGGVLRILSTPGHTEESICIVATESSGRGPAAVFTGDTLFIGDVGRPDLSPTRTPQQLAALLYDSLHQKLLRLPDETVVYPAHGAGSLCGRQMSSEAQSTIGRERVSNYALLTPSREKFVELLTHEMPPKPGYFSREVERNRSGAVNLEELPPLIALAPADVCEKQANGAVVLDTRLAMQFAGAHVPRSIHIGLGGQFASWSARILTGDEAGLNVRLVLVAEDEASAVEARLRLARVGIENVAGYMDGGIFGWVGAGRPVESVAQIGIQELDEWRRAEPDSMILLDVREPSERAMGFIPGSMSIPLSELPQRVGEIDRGKMVLAHCKGGYRSSAATSILQKAEFPQVGNVSGGYDAWELANRTQGASQTAK